MNIHNIHMHIHEGAYLKKKKKRKPSKKKKIDGSSSSDHLRRIPPLPVQVLPFSVSGGFSSEYHRSREAKKYV